LEGSAAVKRSARLVLGLATAAPFGGLAGNAARASSVLKGRAKGGAGGFPAAGGGGNLARGGPPCAARVR